MSKLPVVETFTSIQGEGLLMGKKSFFIRLALCNLQCDYCDTKYSWEKPQYCNLTSTEIINEVKNSNLSHIVITGGEPLLHDIESLTKKLKQHNFHITIETNCSITPSVFNLADFWSVSPKLSTAGDYFYEDVFTSYLEHASHQMQLKFVILTKKDLDEMYTLLKRYKISKNLPIIIQPDGRVKNYSKELKHLTELFLTHDTSQFNIRVLPQLHQVIWPNKRGI